LPKNAMASFASDIAGATRVFPAIDVTGVGFNGTLNAQFPVGFLSDITSHAWYSTNPNTSPDPSEPSWHLLSSDFSYHFDLSSCLDSADYNYLISSSGFNTGDCGYIAETSGDLFSTTNNYALLISDGTDAYYFIFTWNTILGQWVSSYSGLTFSSPSLTSDTDVTFSGTFNDVFSNISPNNVLVYIIPNAGAGVGKETINLGGISIFNFVGDCGAVYLCGANEATKHELDAVVDLMSECGFSKIFATIVQYEKYTIKPEKVFIDAGFTIVDDGFSNRNDEKRDIVLFKRIDCKYKGY